MAASTRTSVSRKRPGWFVLGSVLLAGGLVLLTGSPASAHGLGHSPDGGHGGWLVDLVFLGGPVLTLGLFGVLLWRAPRRPPDDVPEPSECSDRRVNA